MGFLGLLRRKGLFGITWGTPGAQTWPSSLAWSQGLDLTTTSERLKEPFATHPVVACALSIFVEDAASIGSELYPANKRKGDDKIEDHPILTVLDHPAPNMNGFQLRVGTFLSRKLFGEWFWYYPELELGTRGGLKATSEPRGEILLLDPRCVKLDTTGKSPRWLLEVKGRDPIVLDEKRLTQGKRFNPYNPARGLSEIDSVLIEIETDHAAAQYNRAFFRDQKGVPTGLLIPNVQVPGSKEERDAFTERFNADASSHRRRIGTLPPGWDWKDVGVSMKDMEFNDLRSYERELILAAIGVPPFMAGVLDKANYANAREQREAYWLGPQTRFQIEFHSALNADFLPKMGITDLQLYPCWEKVQALIENLAEKVEVAGKLFALGFTKRQINERLELGFDVDEMEDADVGYLPFNVVPVSQVLDPPEPIALPGGDPGDENDPPAKTLAFSEGQEKRRALVWRGLVARTRDLEMRFNQVIRRHFREIEAEVLANVNGIKGWQAVQQKAAADSLLFDIREASLRLIAQTSPIHKSGVKRGGESVLSELSSTQEFNMTDPRVAAKLAELSHKITRIDATVETALRQELVDGLAAGESVAQLADRVRSVMDASKARSMTIARTETGFAFNTGRNESMKQAGVSRHEWLTARDSRVRDIHAEEDGEVVNIGEPFKLADGTTLLYPLDPSGPPGAIINCRCVAVPVVAEA